MHALPAPTTPRSDHTAALLRSRIIDGEFEPGRLLAESAMARELGVSRVPVREALFALERDGLVSFSETGRAYVTALSPQDFDELYTLRLALEPLATRLASPSLTSDARLLENNIKDTKRAKTMLDVTRLDLEFHEIILEASGNGRLLKLWRSMRGELELWLSRLHRRHQVQNLDTRAETMHSHQTIVDCFKQQTPAACEALMRKHITGWREWLPVLPESE
jgi:DNA-binding GntR family transcriptional regulator